MSKYIDAEKLITEIERLKRSVELNREHYNNTPLESRNDLDAYYAQELILNSLIDTITSLQYEQPEVNLTKELDEWMRYGPHTSYPWCTIPDAIKITAEHFYELGLNARKEE